MRIVLFTGKGGVGKTTTAAATAVLAARRGLRTLVLSTDAAHSLADAFGTPLGDEPTEVEPDLFVQQVDAQRRFERSWSDIQGYLLQLLDAAGVDRITAEELTVLPGAEEVLALLELKHQATSGNWDAVLVDCAPTAETLRLLALPEALGWYLDRVLPRDRRLAKALAPVLSRTTGLPAPQEGVVSAVQRLHADLRTVHDLLTGPESSVRLVLTPESVVVAEARRAFTTLSLFGYRVDGVVANRVFPAGGADPWRRTWVDAQEAVLTEVEQSFSTVTVWRSPYRPSEPVGAGQLGELGDETYVQEDPLASPSGTEPLTVRRTAEGAVLEMALPFASSADVDLARHSDDLVVTVGSYRRLLGLPVSLARQTVTGARVDGGFLRVRFRAREATA